ncbi:MAG: ribonuclease D [Xanthomonadales bacterium]|nr:ribonuclease D [Xanthomonadales bacterium]
MIYQSEIDTAQTAANHPVMVESADQLKRSIKTWLELEVLGFDTEFVRERTWRADLGLVQISDGKTVWLVDPLKTGSIEPLSALFTRPSQVKILHAPSEDLDVLLYTTGAAPEPLFDTQTACALLGQSLQMGYHNTAEWLLGVTIDKGETRSNWCKRPLRPAQLHYAALDVCLLPMMYRELKRRLDDLGRGHWLDEECARQVQRATTPVDPEQAWKRINGNGRLDGTSLAILKSLATWRDLEAEKRNLARGFFVKDAALLAIAQRKPENLEALAKVNNLPPKTLQRQGPAIIGMVKKVVAQGLTVQPPKILTPAQRRLLSGMRSLVKKKSAELSVEPALLAPKRELEKLVLWSPGEPLPEHFTGWREDVITGELVALSEGKAVQAG